MISVKNTDYMLNSNAERLAGRTTGDEDLLSGFADNNATPLAGYYTDFAGVRTPVKAISALNDQSGVINPDLPVPSDSKHAEAVEYCCLFHAIENSNDTFTMFELGAGWGPWMAQTASGCKKKGFNKINIIGVEGEENKIPLIKEILTINGFRKDNNKLAQLFNNVYSEIINGVVTVSNDVIEFPVVEVEHYGASLADVTTCDGYPRKKIPGYSLDFLMKDFKIVDYIHFDIQGYEAEVIESAIETLNKKARFICIGTHSRKIEGDLIDLLHKNKWELLREAPCIFVPNKEGSRTLIDMTIQDGVQFWQNKRR